MSFRAINIIRKLGFATVMDGMGLWARNLSSLQPKSSYLALCLNSIVMLSKLELSSVCVAINQYPPDSSEQWKLDSGVPVR